MPRWVYASLFLLGHASASMAPPQSSVQLEKPAFVNKTNRKRLNEDTMCQNVRSMEYAVRGKIVIAADAIAEELRLAKKNGSPLPYEFDQIVFTNIGNPQSVGQKPLTWPRQVMALVDLPDEFGVDHPDAPRLFPADAIQRAREIKEALGHGSSGCYSHSKGVKLLREDVVHFLKQRDGDDVPTDPEDIFLTNGASAAIVMILNVLIADSTW
jgi:aspartate/methionine/tyrosine aminotransferase